MLKPQALVLLSSIVLGQASLIHNVRRQAQSSSVLNFNWTQVNGTDDFQWVPCYRDFECTRLNVPLNHSDPLGSAKVGIAIVRSPATVSKNSSDYKGAVFWNPGGPGDSGVETLVGFRLVLGDALRQRVGPSYDLVGFDPRGIAHSTPLASFFDTQCQRDQWWPTEDSAKGGISSAAGLQTKWARARVIGPLAEKQSVQHGGFLQHINTENTARDIVYMNEKYGGGDKVQYYGTSYGTLLGVTFATMFPDKVGRMVIDGVTDPDEYYSSSWRGLTADFNKTLGWFYDSCFQAGQDACPFWSSSPDQIKQELESLLDSVRAKPIPVTIDDVHYGVVNLDVLRDWIFNAIYTPFTPFGQGGFLKLAQSLADLRNGNASSVWTLATAGSQDAVNNCTSNDAIPSYIDDGLVTMECNDGASINDTSFASLLKWYEEQNRTSPWADFGVRQHLNCFGWPKWPKTEFQGKIGGKTSTPLLVVSNTADNVTPLINAEKVNKLFPGSVLLKQNCPGHSSLAGVSNCTAQTIQAYFNDSTLPKEGTTCQLNANPPLFPVANSSVAANPTKQD